jgi:3-polyprenyl-4-hydroxybenzoate decarboxylase
MGKSIMVGISGASGIIYGIRLLETLKSLGVETYLIMSEWAEKKLARMGIIIAPPMPAFYFKPNSILEMVDQQVGRIIDLLGVENHLAKRWGED